MDGPVQGLLRGLGLLSSWWVLNIASYALVVALLALRRFRQLMIWLILATLLTLIASVILALVAQRPRPFGIEIREGWGGWAMPSQQVTLFSAGLVTTLYALVPEGRWRNTGKWVVAALITLTTVGRVGLGADAPTDVLVGAALGVTIPLVAYRWFAPSEVFPITFRRGSGAHLDVGGARGAAIRRGLEEQLGLVATEVKPFGLAGSAGSTPLRITVKGDPPAQLFGKLYARSHLRSDRWDKLGRELLYGRLEDEKPFNTARRLVQQEDYALSLMQRAGLPSPTPHGFVELTPNASLRRSGADVAAGASRAVGVAGPLRPRAAGRLVAGGRGRQRRPDGDQPAPRPGRRGHDGQADPRLRRRERRRGGLGPGRGQTLPAGRAAGAALPRGPLRRVPRRVPDHQDHLPGAQPGPGHRLGRGHHRLHLAPDARPGPGPALGRAAPPRPAPALTGPLPREGYPGTQSNHPRNTRPLTLAPDR
jgi:membrane-associated phospholipid phosphatase